MALLAQRGRPAAHGQRAAARRERRPVAARVSPQRGVRGERRALRQKTGANRTAGEHAVRRRELALPAHPAPIHQQSRKRRPACAVCSVCVPLCRCARVVRPLSTARSSARENAHAPQRPQSERAPPAPTPVGGRARCPLSCDERSSLTIELRLLLWAGFGKRIRRLNACTHPSLKLHATQHTKTPQQ